MDIGDSSVEMVMSGTTKQTSIRDFFTNKSLHKMFVFKCAILCNTNITVISDASKFNMCV